MNVTWYTLEDIKNETDRGVLVAVGLTSWANCMVGNKPPEHFGEMMVELGKKLDITPTPDEFTRLSKKILRPWWKFW